MYPLFIKLQKFLILYKWNLKNVHENIYYKINNKENIKILKGLLAKV
jgi:hypothetical protein